MVGYGRRQRKGFIRTLWLKRKEEDELKKGTEEEVEKERCGNKTEEEEEGG
jgi:hypothetical protein